MIVGIGIDSVEIARFEPWVYFPKKQLSRIYSADELTYALSNPRKSAERLAVRFAAREALFKALSPCIKRPIPFLTLCASCHVITLSTTSLQIDFERLRSFITIPTSLRPHLSLTHTATTAMAYVILEK